MSPGIDRSQDSLYIVGVTDISGSVSDDDFREPYEKNKIIQSEKGKLFMELAHYPHQQVEKLFEEITDRTDLSTANIFCLALMLNVMRRKHDE